MLACHLGENLNQSYVPLQPLSVHDAWSPVLWRKTKAHLEYLHLQILSIVPGAQLKRIFERRTNFDLRRLLNGKINWIGNPRFFEKFLVGAESFMTSMLFRLELDLSMSMSALNFLKLNPNLRKRTGESLVQSSKMKVRIAVWFIHHYRSHFVPEGHVVCYPYR